MTTTLKYGEDLERGLNESLGLRQRIHPFNVTLSAESTAEDLINIQDFDPPSVNLVTNSSFESRDDFNNEIIWKPVDHTTSTQGTGSIQYGFIERSATPGRVYHGDSSVFIQSNAGPESGGIYTTIDNVSPGSGYVASTYVYSDATGGTAAILVSPDEGETFTEVARRHTVNRDVVFERMSGTYVVPNGVYSIRLYLVGYKDTSGNSSSFDNTFDAVQFEPNWNSYYAGDQPYSRSSGALTPFIDPANDRNARWEGEENASISVREPNISEIHKVVIYSTTNNFYFDFDRDAKLGESIYLPEDSVYQEKTIVKERISAISEELAEIHGYVIGK